MAAGEPRDVARIAFYPIGIGADQILRTGFDGKMRATAIGIYATLSSIAAANRSYGLTVNRATIAHYAGVTTATLDTYVRRFEQLGLIAVDRRPRDANTYTLLEVTGDSREKPTAHQEANQPHTKRQTNRPPLLNAVKKDREEEKIVPLRGHKWDYPNAAEYDEVTRR